MLLQKLDMEPVVTRRKLKLVYTGCAYPAQFGLYEKAGCLKMGSFLTFQLNKSFNWLNNYLRRV